MGWPELSPHWFGHGLFRINQLCSFCEPNFGFNPLKNIQNTKRYLPVSLSQSQIQSITWIKSMQKSRQQSKRWTGGIKLHTYQFDSSIISPNALPRHWNIFDSEWDTIETELPGYIHASEFHVHSHQLHSTDTSSFHSLEPSIQLLTMGTNTVSLNNNHTPYNLGEQQLWTYRQEGKQRYHITKTRLRVGRGGMTSKAL